MLKPSELSRRYELLEAWRPYGDIVIWQLILQMEGLPLQPDVFQVPVANGSLPRCGKPFSYLVVAYDGTVPLCGPALFKDTHPHNTLGNIHDKSLLELFHSPVLRQYRAAHRSGRIEKMPRCKGCSYAGL
jgi:radical SAM protein with 4Fe4S-binding SPASM domain